MKKYLFKFDRKYYAYPTSISRGYWGRYPIENGLSDQDLQRRREWKDSFKTNDLNCQLNQILGNVFEAFDVDESILKLHGIFFERFYKLSIKDHAVKLLCSDEVILKNITSAVRLDKSNAHLAEKKHDLISLVVDSIFEYQLVKIVESDKKILVVQCWYEKHSQVKECKICGNLFRVIDIPDWVYFSSNGNKECCFHCEIVEKPLKKDLHRIIPEFVDLCGFIPKTNSHPLEYSFSSRFDDAKWMRVTALYAQMGGIDHVVKKYGSWFKAMVDTKAVPNGVKITTRGLWCVSDDGHQCHSMDEQTIDNWLYSNDIEHLREPLYPQHDTLNKHGKRRADWQAGDVFIEYFGLAGDKKYDKKTEEKIMLSVAFDITLIAIYPRDMLKLDEKLNILLTQNAQKRL